METLFVSAFRRLRPRYGWVPFSLLALMLAALLGATLEVGWVPQAPVVMPIAAVAFVLAALLAHSKLSAFPAWLILTLTGVALSGAALADLRPPRQLWAEGSGAIFEFAGQRVVLFGDRVASWVEAVAGGERSTETMAFALGLALAAWLVAAFLAWSVFRLNRPLAGITAAGVAMALTGYFGQAPLYWAVSFIGLAVTVVAVLHYGAMEATWERRGIDYSSEIKGELLIAAAFTGMLLMSLAFALPSVNIRSIAQAFRGQPAVADAEAALERAFAGVEQPRLDDSASQAAASRPAGVLPRAFLLGAAPDLLETVVMTATVVIDPAGGTADRADDILAHSHWRGASYDIYTGRGWQRSGEREVIVPANEPVPYAVTLPMSVPITQSIVWASSPLLTRYAIGSPVSFDHATITYWRGEDELSRISAGSANAGDYQTTSRVIPRDEQALRETSMEDVPRVLFSRHTDLPADLPQRIHDLAHEVAFSDPNATPYDQARAIERFLRQYPYSLDVPLPPPDVDMTDYFLFDLQRGFCDYYATAMVVLARTVGLPARLGTGFLQPPAAESGEQLIRQSSAHSWAEIYFPGTGWVEFEPTAPTAAPESPIYAANDYPQDDDFDSPSPSSAVSSVSVPDRAPQRDIPWPLLIVAAVLGGIIVVPLGRRIWRRHRTTTAGLDAVESAYALLVAQAADLGIMARPGETALELAERVNQTAEQMWAALGLPLAVPTRQINRVAALFAEHQYARRLHHATAPASDEARLLAHDLRTSFRRLRWQRFRASLRRSGQAAAQYEVQVTNHR